MRVKSRQFRILFVGNQLDQFMQQQRLKEADLLDAADCSGICIPVAQRLADAGDDVDFCFALEGDDACIGDRLQFRASHILERMADQSQGLGIRRIESIRKNATCLGRASHDEIENRVSGW